LHDDDIAFCMIEDAARGGAEQLMQHARIARADSDQVHMGLLRDAKNLITRRPSAQEHLLLGLFETDFDGELRYASASLREKELCRVDVFRRNRCLRHILREMLDHVEQCQARAVAPRDIRGALSRRPTGARKIDPDEDVAIVNQMFDSVSVIDIDAAALVRQQDLIP